MSGTKEYTFSAGEVNEYEGGRAFFVHSAGADDLTVKFFRRGQKIHVAEGVGKSYTFKLDPDALAFDMVSIKAATAQTVLFEISEHGEAGSFVISGSLSVTIGQGDTLSHSASSIGTTAAMIAAASSTRKSLHITNNSANTVYIGGSTITTANGAVILAPGDEHREESGAGAEWWAVADGAASDVRVMRVE